MCIRDRMCGEAPVTPPAQACSLPLDGSPANCPDEIVDWFKPDRSDDWRQRD